MTPAEARDSHRWALDQYGETVILKRSGDATDYSVKAIVKGASPSQMGGNIQQLERMAIIMAEEVAASGFPTPFRPKQDRLVWNGKTVVITSVNDAKRRMQGVLIAYELELSGA